MCHHPTSDRLWLAKSHRLPAGRWLAAVVAVALLTGAAPAGSPESKVRTEKVQFTSAGKPVAVEVFAPREDGQYPTVVLLHAVDGLAGANAASYDTLGREYAAKGYVIHLVHYFDRTSTDDRERAGYRELFVRYFSAQGRDEKKAAQVKELFGAWAETVRDAVAHARSRPEVDGDRVALVGFSLGGSLALAAAGQGDLKLAALVEYFGALPHELRPGLKNLPPTLIFHGETDRLVPVEEAYLLVGLLVARKLQPEVEVYPGVDHMFYKDGKTFQAVDAYKAKLRTDAFLDKHLRGKPATQGEK
jgi:carboxymethylenebutenolidase